MFVLRTNNKIDCFTRRHVGQLPNGERGYTVLGHRGARPPRMEKYRGVKQAKNNPASGAVSIDGTSATTPVAMEKPASYRADASVFRPAVLRPEDTFSNSHNQDSVPSWTFLASRLTRKWPVNKSSAYRQTQISSYPSKFKTGDRKMSKSETMVTSQRDSISEQADPIAAMIAGKSANYVVDKSIGLMPARQLFLPRSSPLIMARDTLIPNSDFRKSWKKMVL
ncbi:uncharacterized protein LOC110451481 [Mizuhopecten yessoensis]|nr:uncharacterized protein LOC110451481 [Mizuhopecten yessoensis]